MVVHDENRVQTWMQEKEEREKAENQKATMRTWHFSVLAVQSIACCVIVLVVLLLRVAGGDAYASLRGYFRQALARNELATVLSQVWGDEPLKHAETAGDKSVKQENFTPEKGAQETETLMAKAAVHPLVSGTLTSDYGSRVHPITHVEEFHTGVDIAAPAGSSLVAMFDGTVKEVGENDAVGKYVRLQHSGGVEVMYGHCQDIVASAGAVISAGDTVALVGSTGISTGSHVHVCVFVDGKHCDPSAFVSLERYA